MAKFAPNIFIVSLFLFTLFSVLSIMYSLAYSQPEPLVVSIIKYSQAIVAAFSLIYIYFNNDVWYN